MNDKLAIMLDTNAVSTVCPACGYNTHPFMRLERCVACMFNRLECVLQWITRA